MYFGCDQDLTKVPIEAITDCKSLYENVYSNKGVADKRLRIDIGALRELLSTKRLSSIQWVNTEDQLADVLTKAGPSCNNLQLVLSRGQLFL